MKIVLRIVFGIAFLLVAFFGLGPVLIADGMPGERTLTLIVVIGIFALLYVVYRWLMKKKF
jgi:high-affinity Fe2+/Pb2+ permease